MAGMNDWISMLLQGNPQMFGGMMTNPDAFAAMADHANLPLPGSTEMESISNPFGGLGSTLAGGPVPGAPTGLGLGGGPMPVMPQGAPDATMDPRGMLQTSDILAALGGGTMGAPTTTGAPGSLDASGNPIAAAAQQQRPMGKITPPTVPQPEYRAGVAGSQKAPAGTLEKPQDAGISPTQALMQALLGQGGKGAGGLAVPGLGEFLR